VTLMKKRFWVTQTLCAAFVGCLSAPIEAAPVTGQGRWETSLLPRDWAGNGSGIDAYYDPLFDITWLADANFAQTSGFDDNGRMTFAQASDWVSGLTLFGGTGWRLPTLSPLNGSSFDTSFSTDGSTDLGSARTGIGWGTFSEMGFMHYVHLGNGASPTLSGSLVNTGPFSNLIDDFYWTDTIFSTRFSGELAWEFNFSSGRQFPEPPVVESRAWAVHPGDLIGPAAAPIPLPGSLWLLGSAVAGIATWARRPRSRAG
jgi:hypothetical protein